MFLLCCKCILSLHPTNNYQNQQQRNLRLNHSVAACHEITYPPDQLFQGISYYSFSFIHSAISIVPLKVLYYSEALPTTAQILYRSFALKRTGNCRQRTCPRSLHGG